MCLGLFSMNPKGSAVKFFSSRICRQGLVAVPGFFWLLVASTLVCAGEPLIWKFAVGDAHHYQLVQTMNMTMSLGPSGETASTVKQTIGMTWEVKSVEANGTAVLLQTIDRIEMDLSAPGQKEVHFDTASDESPEGFAAMLAPTLNALTSTPFKVTMTPRGEITEVEVPETLVAVMAQGPGGAILGDLATEEGFRNTVQQSSLTLPEAKDLVEGHQWNSTFEMENPATGKIVVETTYAYQGPREVAGQAMEVFVPTLLLRFGKGPDQTGGTIRVERQESGGEILFNRSAGRLESTTLRQQVDLVIMVGENSINQHIDQKISLRIMEEK